VLCLDDPVRGGLERALPDATDATIELISPSTIPEISALTGRPTSRFAVACKPFLLDWLTAKKGVEQALYLDSDTWFIKNPSFLFDLLKTSKVLLIPAVIDPEISLRDWPMVARNAQRTGHFNAGFVGCSADAQDFLGWWKNRCAYSTGRDFYLDISGDQKYLTWVPCLFPDVTILRHHGLNIKAWAVNRIDIPRDSNGGVRLAGDPAVFFHFSQNLGYLTAWPSALHPEVKQYLDDVEQARRDIGLHPFVDMSRRQNLDLVLPLLPRAGKVAAVVRFSKRYREVREAAGFRARRVVTGAAKVLPLAVRDKVAARYLDSWNLEGDVPLEAYQQVIATVPPRRRDAMLFAGVTRLALLAAYRGHEIEVLEPFQGHYNSDLKTLFNPQVEDFLRHRRIMALEQRVRLHRSPLVGPLPNLRASCLFLIARRTPSEVATLLTEIRRAPYPKHLVALFDPSWPADYRERWRRTITETLESAFIPFKSLNAADIFRRVGV
jgi:hypothetical protein